MKILCFRWGRNMPRIDFDPRGLKNSDEHNYRFTMHKHAHLCTHLFKTMRTHTRACTYIFVHKKCTHKFPICVLILTSIRVHVWFCKQFYTLYHHAF